MEQDPPPPPGTRAPSADGHLRSGATLPGSSRPLTPPPPARHASAGPGTSRPWPLGTSFSGPTMEAPAPPPPGMGDPPPSRSEQQRCERRPPCVAPSCPAFAPAVEAVVPSSALPNSGFMELLSAMGGFGSGATGVPAVVPFVPVEDAPAVETPAMAATALPWASVQDNGCTTPTKHPILQTMDSSFVPYCKDEFKPVVGMSFDSLKAVEDFYKRYAHEAGFAVRVGGHTKVLNQIENKRFYCTRQGFMSQKTDIVPSGKKRKQKMHSVTRCGCNAHIYVKLGPDDKYYIASIVEQHNHGLVSPDKTSFLSSNRSISQRVKNNLFTCHKARIGTSQAYRLLQVSDGFENIGCMKRDVQNYYRGLREKIKNADAQLLVAQMDRKKEANPAFFYDFVVDDEGKLIYIFWADATSRKNYRHFGDVVSFDATYSTNQYNMKFGPFTGVNHHMQSVFLGGAFIVKMFAQKEDVKESRGPKSYLSSASQRMLALWARSHLNRSAVY